MSLNRKKYLHPKRIKARWRSTYDGTSPESLKNWYEYLDEERLGHQPVNIPDAPTITEVNKTLDEYEKKHILTGNALEYRLSENKKYSELERRSTINAICKEIERSLKYGGFPSSCYLNYYRAPRLEKLEKIVDEFRDKGWIINIRDGHGAGSSTVVKIDLPSDEKSIEDKEKSPRQSCSQIIKDSFFQKIKKLFSK